MTKLHFVGFNGYHQCPTNENQSSKVVADWICIQHPKIFNLCCGHRITAVEFKDSLKLYGFLEFDSDDCLQVIEKPHDFDAVNLCEEFLIACHSTDLWVLHYKTMKWEKIEYSFDNEEEACVWRENDVKIMKLSFLNKSVIILLSNGSVWRLDKTHLSLIFPYDLDKAIDISSGFEHCLILTESGCVLSFGNGSRGQLGHGDLNLVEKPAQISALEGLKVVIIAAGGWHSCAVTDSGDLCTWGWNNYGQLSNDSEELGVSAVPVFVDVGRDSEVRVIDVACGSRHTVALLENGETYSTGWNTYHQLGIDSTDEKICQFTKVKIQPAKSRKLVCGSWYTILIDEDLEE